VLASHYFIDVDKSVRREMLDLASALLGGSEMLPGSRYHREGAAVVSRLLENGSLSGNECFKLTGREIGQKLLESNVFALHFISGQVTFQSMLMKRACEEHHGAWKR
jgi:hypothetical protein